MFEVTYDHDKDTGACGGRLTIKEDGEIIYCEEYCCTSTGECYTDDDDENVLTLGVLLWDDADKYSEEVQAAVSDVLATVEVCCGNCL